METKAKLPKKLLSMFLAVLMAFSCFSLVMPELVPEAKAASANYSALQSAFDTAKAAGVLKSGNAPTGTVIEDTSDKGYLYNIAEALIAVVKTEHDNGVVHNLRLRQLIKSNISLNQYQQAFVDTMLPMLSDNYSNYPLQNASGSAGNAYTTNNYENKTTGNPASVTTPSAGSAVSVTVKRSASAAILDDYNSVTDVPANVVTSIKVTYTPGVNSSEVKKEEKVTEGSGCNEKEVTYYWNERTTRWKNGSVASSTETTAHGVSFSAITTYLTYVTTDTQFVADYNAWVADSSVIYDWNYDRLNTVVTNYNNGGADALNTWALTSPNSLYVAKFVPNKAAEKGYDAFVSAVSSTLEAASYKKYVDWIMDDVTFGEYPMKSAYNAASDLADDRAQMVALRQNATDFKAIIDGKNGMAQTLADIYGYDQTAYQTYIDHLTDCIEQYDLRQVKYVAEFRAENDSTKVYNNPYKNAPGKGFFGITDHVSYPYTQMDPPQDCPVDDDMLEAAYQDYLTYISIVDGMQNENVTAVFTDFTEADLIKVKNDLLVEINFRGRELEFGDFASYFEGIISSDWSTRTAVFIEDKIAEAKAKVASLEALYNTTVSQVGAEKAAQIFGTFIADRANKAAIDDTLYQALYVRIYNQLKYVQDVRSSGVNAENFSLVKRALKLVDHELYKYVVETTGVGAYYTQAEIDALTAMFDLLDVYQTEVENQITKMWQIKRVNLEVEGTDYYTIREAVDQDMVRDSKKDAHDYYVTNTKVEQVIDKIDAFVTSTDFTQLLGVYDEEKGIDTLADYINDMIVTSLFTDEMVNTLVSMMFPMLANLLVSELKGMLNNLGDMSGTPTDGATAAIKLDGLVKPGTVVKEDVTLVGDIVINSVSGNLNLWLDGDRGSMKIVDLAKQLGLNVFPDVLASTLASSVNKANYTDIISKLSSAGIDWNNLDADGDGEITVEDFADFKWGVHDYDSFVTVIGDIFNAVLPLLRAVFTNTTFSKEVTSGSADCIIYANSEKASFSITAGWLGTAACSADAGAGGIKGKITEATIGINGIRGYENVWATLFETFGVTETTNNFEVTIDKPLSTTIGNDVNGKASAKEFVNALFMPIMALINRICNKPLDTVLNILPNLTHSLTYNLVQELLNALNLQLTLEGINLDIEQAKLTGDNGWGTVIGLLDGLLPGILEGAINPLSLGAIDLELGSMLNLSELIGADISDLNAIIEMIFATAIEDLAVEGIDAIDIPTFNTGLVASLGTLTTASSIRVQNYNGYPEIGAGQRPTIVADRADVLYYLIQWVFEFIAEGDNLARLLLLLDMGTLDDSITQLLGNIDAENALAALCELFEPNMAEDVNGIAKSVYEMAEYNWYQPNSLQSVYQFTGADFVYLKYANNWTVEKAEYVYDNLDGIINTIIGMIDPAMLEGYENGVSDMFFEKVNEIFNNKGIGGVLKMLTDIGKALAGQDAVNAILRNDLGIDLTVWYNTFGYLFSDYYGEEEVEVEPEEGEVVDPDAEPETEMVPFGPPTPADGQYGKPGVDYGTYENLFPLLKVEVIETKEPQLDKDKNPVFDEETDEQLFTTTYEYKFIYDGKELVDGSEGARLVFTDIFTYLAQPLAPVVELLLTGKSITLFNGAITFNGADAYAGALIPLFETLGIKMPTPDEYKAMCETDVDGVDGASIAFNYLIDILFNYVDEFLSVTTLADGTVYGPFQRLVDLVPSVVYFLQSGGLSTILKNLLHAVWVLVDTVRPLVDLDIDDFIHQFLCQYLELTYNKEEYGSSDIVNLLMDLIDPDYVAPEYTDEAAAEDKATVDTIYSITIEDLSIPAIFKLLNAMFGIDLAPLTYAIEGMAMSRSVVENGEITNYGVESYPSANGKTAGRVKCYGPDVITVLISAILDVLRYGENAAAIDGLLGFINENTEEGVETDITAAGLLEALLVVFEDKVGIEYETPNWDYLLEGKYVQEEDGNSHEWVDNDYDTLAVASDFSQYHTLKNLDYLTDWTETTAQVTEAQFSGLLDFVASMIDENYDDLGAYLNDLLKDNLFTAENLKGLVDTIAQLYDFLPADILDLVDELLDIDLKSWLAYVELTEVEEEGEKVTKYAAKADHEWWADPEAEAYVDTKEEFLSAIETLLHGVDTLVGLIFLGEDYKLFHTMGDGQDAPDHGDDAIVLNGFNAYGYSIAPIFEALGYTVESGDLKPVTYYVVEENGKTVYKNAELIHDFVTLLAGIVDEIAADPAKWIINVLPGLTYFINANGLAVSVNNILNSVNEVIDAINSILGEEDKIDLSELLGDIDLSNLTMGALLKFVEELGIYVNPALTSIVANFYMGDVVVFDSANGNRAFTMTYTDAEQKHDMVTVLLAFLLEVVTDAGKVTDADGNEFVYDNAAAIDALIAGEDGENKGIVSAIVAAVKDPDSVIYGNIDWGYMYEEKTLDERTAKLAADGFPGAALAYLDYSTDWTDETADEIYSDLNGIIKFVLEEFADGNTLAQLLESVLKDNVYTDKNLKTIVELIVNALAGVNESLRNIIGAVVTADIGAWFAMCDKTTNEEGKTVYVLKENYFGVDTATDKKQAFIDGIMEIIIPANRLLSWLFFEDTYTFFTSTTNEPIITLQGGKGYAEGLVPILEALGLEMQPAENFWIQPLDGTEGYYNAAGAVEGILESVLGLVDKISKNPSKEALALIPNLLYFINADGLKTSVKNLVAPIDTVLRSLKSLVGGSSIAELLAETIGFDLNNLSTETVLGILASDKVGFVLNEKMLPVIDNIYALGKADEFVSANGKQAFRVDITGREDDVLTVILSFAIDAFKENDDLFIGLLDKENPGLYASIISILAGVEAQIRETDWGYMYEGEKLADRTATLVASGFPATKITYLKNTRDWTTETATAAYKALDEILDMVLPTVLEGKANLKELVTNLLNDEVFTDANLEAIVQLIVDALMTFDADLYNAVGALVDADINTWFETMCEEVPLLDEEGNTTLDENNEMVMTYVVKKGYFGVAEATDKQKAFVDGLKAVLAPASELLNWLLFGGKYEFLKDAEGNVLITLNGGEGYKYGLAPILEALGCTNLNASDINTGIDALVNSVVGLLANLENSENTVAFALNLIPNLLYFINAGGLKASVSNLVAPVNAVLAELSTVLDGKDNLGALLEDVIHINIEELDLDSLLGLIPEDVTFNMTDGMKEALEHIYVVDNDGKAESFTSVSGKTAYKITADGGKTLTVILSFALEAFKQNGDLFKGLLDKENPGLYDSIISILNGVTSEVKDIDWAYMYGTDAGKTQFYTEPKFPATKITYLESTRDWTAATATAAYNALDNILDMVLPAVLEDNQTLLTLVTNLLNDEVFTDANLEAIVQLIVNALAGFDADLYNAVGALVNGNIGTWFDDMCEEIKDADGKVTGYKVIEGQFKVAEATDKKAAFVAGLKEVLAPASKLLNWLLFGGEYTFFNGTDGKALLTLKGGNGYALGLAPILEALGCTNLNASDINTGIDALVNSVVGLLANLENSENTVAFALNLIPNLLYFINAGGLKASVSNLVAPVNAVLAELSTVLDGKDNLGALLEDVIHINIEELDLDSLLGLIPADVNFEMTAAMEEALEHIYVVDDNGKAESFTSVSGKTAYEITADGGKTLTVILSFALEAFKQNGDLFKGLLDKENPGLYDSIISILNGVTSEVKDIDWAYMYGTDAGKTQFYTEPKFPATKITYLESTRDWTAATATAAYNALDEILDMVLPAVLEGNANLKELVTNLLNDEVFTDANLEAIVELIVNALAGFDADLYKAVGALVDGNIGTWFDDMCEEIKDADGNVTGYKVIEGQFKVADATDKQKAFVDGLKAVLAPASELLNWLLFGGEYTFFNGTDGKALLTLKGGNGYALGLAPILEALGCTNLNASDINTGIDALVNSVVGLLANLENSESTVAFALNLIPNLLYFINAGGLKASVSNLVAPVNAVLAELSTVLDGKDNLGALLEDVIHINIEELDLDSLLGLIPEDVTFNMTDGMKEALEHIYVVDNDGAAESFTSVSGKTAYEITADGGKTLTVILSFALEAFKKNDALFSDLLGADVYTAVKTLLAGVEATLFDIDWAYMYATDAEKQQFYAEPKFPATKLQYLAYTTDWTEDTAVAVYNALDNILDMVLPGLLNGKANLKELVENLLNGSLYTDANLEAIVELIVNLLADFDADLYNAVGALVDADISTWFTMCAEVDATDAEGNIILGEKVWVVTKDFGVDEAADKKAAFVAGLKEVLAPAEGLLAWLFLGRDFTFLNGTTNDPLITIKGGQGYELGLVPILEALGCEMKPAAETVGETVENIIESVLALLENLTSSASTVEFAFNLIPNLLYFINAGGLKASVNNLVAPVDAVIATLSGLIGEESLAALLTDVIGIDISNLTTDALLGILKSELGFKMNGAMEGTIRRIFALGKAEAFTSANGKTAYKLVAEPADTLTVLLSFALDAFNLNDALFTDLFGAEIYTSVKTLIKGVNGIISDIDWGYMYDGETVADRTAALKAAGKFAPVSDFQYLKYATNWTADTADKVYAALDDILVLVLPSLLGENENLKTLVEGILNKNVYTTENLEAIVELIVNALAGFDADLYNAVGALVDADISTWFNMCTKNAEGKYEVKPGTFKVTDKASFVAGLKAVLQPANELLSWLFFGTEFTFFNGTTNNPLITINGGKGYAYGLVPILEALGVTGLKKALDYKGADGKYDVGAAVADILDRVLALLDNLVAADSTVEFAFTLIPNLLYFINADGIKTSVNNLVAPVDAVIATLSGVIGEESLAALLTDVIGIDIANLDTDTLLGLLEKELKFVMNDGMKQAVKDIHAVGAPAVFTSASGKTAYKLVPDMGDALTVILSFALDAFNLNEKLFSDLLGAEEYKAVYNLIRGAKEEFKYAEIDWGYMYDGAEAADRLAALAGNGGNLPKYAENSTAATYLLYGNNWNKETAEYLNLVVDKLVDEIIKKTGKEDLGIMLDNAIAGGLYKDSILNSLLESVVGLIVDYAGIVEGAGALLTNKDEPISEWFSYFNIEKDADGKVISCEIKDEHAFGIDKAVGNDAKRTAFINAFATVLKPAYRLLAWLLFDQEYTFFNGTTNDPLITLTGGRGYEEGLVPLLEAIGAKMPGTDGTYVNGKSAIKPASAYVTTDANGKVIAVDMSTAVTDVFSALVGWLEMLCGNLQNQGEYGVIGAMLDLLPNVIYNINAGTLKAIVSNLLVPVEEILGHLEAFGLEVDFSNLVKIGDKTLDLKNLDWYAVFDIVAELVGLYWPEKIEDFLATLYVGKAVEYASANGKTAYYMTYNAKEQGDFLVSGREDMITLLISFVIDGVLDERNAPRLKGWFGADIYNVIIAYLTDSVEKVPMKDIDWALTKNPNLVGQIVSPITLGARINSEFYGELYTREMGEYINTWLPSFIDTMIVLLGVEAKDGTNYEGLEDILNELIGDTLYTKANLQKILDLVKGLIPMAEEALGTELFNIVVNVLDSALEIDLTYWDTYKVADFKDGNREAFVNGLTDMFKPLYPILSWLLTDEDLIALFYKDTAVNQDGSKDAVVIKGAEGYAYGIIPLLEAFDYDSELILTPEEFKAASTDAPTMLKNILNPVLDVVDKVLADPVNEIFNVLPGVIYFVNSNGLDTVIKNTANAVFTVLESIEDITGELDIYELIGFDAENMNVESLISELIAGLEKDTGFQLTEVAMEALKELTVGKLIGYTSQNGKQAYTVVYDEEADRADMVTVVLRLVLTFVSIPENVKALEGMLEGQLDAEGYKFLCSLLENFQQMAASEGGMDEIMYTVYQIFYAANVAAHSTEDWLAEFNGDYSFLNQLFATSDLAFLRQLEVSLGDLLNKYTGDIIDDNEVVPNGFIAFFQKIADFFKKIGDFFRNLFK